MTASLVVAALVAFVATTVDDLVVVTALFVLGKVSGRPGPWVIVGGQFLGSAVIIGVSLAAAAGLHVVPDRWVGLLGLLPIGLGLWGLWSLFGDDEDAGPVLGSTVVGIAAVTLANGADEVSVFTPLLRSMDVVGTLVTTAGFLVLVGVWCGLGALLGTHRAVVATVGRVAHWLVPVVFLAVGVLVLVSTGAASLIGGGRL